MRETTCCFTGHRPGRLELYSAAAEPIIKERLKTALDAAVEMGCTRFVSGLAMGFDLWAADAVLKMREADSRLSLVGISPHAGQSRGWPPYWQLFFDRVAHGLDEHIVLFPRHQKGCELLRNRFMVEMSSVVIACFDGAARGGTSHTVHLAEKYGLEVINVLDPPL